MKGIIFSSSRRWCASAMSAFRFIISQPSTRVNSNLGAGHPLKVMQMERCGDAEPAILPVRFPRGAKNVIASGWTVAIVIGGIIDVPLWSRRRSCRRSFSWAPKRTQRARPVDFIEREREEEEEKTEKGSAAVGRDGESWRPRRASSASSSPRPSESRILLSTRSSQWQACRARVRTRRSPAWRRWSLPRAANGTDSSHVRWSADPPTRHPRRMGTDRSLPIVRWAASNLPRASTHRGRDPRTGRGRDMPRCRRGAAASRGQVLLLRLLLVCALVAAGRQEGKFTRADLPAETTPEPRL